MPPVPREGQSRSLLGHLHSGHLAGETTYRRPYSSRPGHTFQVADLTLTVRPLLVRVHFMRRKKVRSVLGSLVFLEPEGSHRERRRGERKGGEGTLGLLSVQY